VPLELRPAVERGVGRIIRCEWAKDFEAEAAAKEKKEKS